MEESELIKFVQKFLEKGIEDDEIEKYNNLKLDESSQDNQHRKIVGIGSLQGLELVENSHGRTISGLKLSRDYELYINPSNYTPPFKGNSGNSTITIAIKNCTLGWYFHSKLCLLFAFMLHFSILSPLAFSFCLGAAVARFVFFHLSYFLLSFRNKCTQFFFFFRQRLAIYYKIYAFWFFYQSHDLMI